jgi:L-ascorbate metabolism protein UlaG (beta-lactamase superfamily)
VSAGTRMGRKLVPRTGEAGIWWLGQAMVGLRGVRANVLVDPFLSPHPDRLVPPPFAAREVGGLHAILCTHEHLDHFDEEALPELAEASPEAVIVVPEPIVDAVTALGIDASRVVGAQPDRAIELDALSVHPVPACHGIEPSDAYTFGRELSNGLYRYLGYVVELGGVRVYHAGDTIPFDGLEERLRELAVDVALLPINGRDPEREAQGIVGNMDAREAAHVAEASGVDAVVPIHFDMFEANLGDPAALVDAVQRERLDVAVIVPSRRRPFLYSRGQR